MAEIWIAEDLPAYRIFPSEPPPPPGQDIVRTILEHRSRASAGNAMGHYLTHLARMEHNKSQGLHALVTGAADMFRAYAPPTPAMALMLRIGSRVYRIRRSEES